MSVINIQNRITDNIEIFEKFISSDQSYIFSDANSIEEWSIELTVGQYFSDEIGSEPSKMYYVKDEICIKPQSSIIIEVNEELRIPNNIYGLILPKGTLLLEHGILMASTKIESRFQGKLKLLFYNTTKKRKYLNKNTVIGSCLFMRTEVTLFGQSIKQRPEPIRTENTFGVKLFRFLKTDFKWAIATLIAIAAILISIFKQ